MSFLIPLFQDTSTLPNLFYCGQENGETANAADEISELADTQQTQKATANVYIDETNRNQRIYKKFPTKAPKIVIKTQKGRKYFSFYGVS
jgi:hypothetical protein